MGSSEEDDTIEIRLVKTDGLIDLSQAPSHLVSIVNRNASSPFLRLPGELRNEIYEYVMVDLKLVVHGTYTGKVVPCGKTDRATKMTFCLPRVCRQFYSDTFVLLFEKTTILYIQNTKIERFGRDVVSPLPKSRVDTITTVSPSPPWNLRNMASLFPALQRVNLCGSWRRTDMPGLGLEDSFQFQRRVGEKWERYVEVRWHDEDLLTHLLLGVTGGSVDEKEDCYKKNSSDQRVA